MERLEIMARMAKVATPADRAIQAAALGAVLLYRFDPEIAECYVFDAWANLIVSAAIALDICGAEINIATVAKVLREIVCSDGRTALDAAGGPALIASLIDDRDRIEEFCGLDHGRLSIALLEGRGIAIH